ncbi:MAG: cytochrome C [Janthinobacterium lividum]
MHPYKRVCLRKSIVSLVIVSMSVSGLAMTAHGANPDPASVKSGQGGLVERGRYLADIAGCNDCHTPGYAQNNGKAPRELLLTGVPMGWQGPWGTTYASNLRLALKDMSEQEWMASAPLRRYRPPMPWWALREMRKDDLRALYRFIKSLGPGGEAMPPYLPPGQQPAGPVMRAPMPAPR